MALNVKSAFWVIVLATCGLIAACMIPRPAAADAQTHPWAEPIPLASGLSNAAHPSLAFTPDRAEHVVWETEGEIRYTYRKEGAAWSTPLRIAYGSSPSLAVGSDGRLHLVFVAEIFDNYEIYHIFQENGAWSTPVNVSHTSGLSSEPTIAAAADGLLYVAWIDSAPTYWMIYYGIWNGDYWVSHPVDNARGQAPALAISNDGSIYLAWQDRVPTLDDPTGKYDIFLSQLSDSGWSLPINISDDAQLTSIGAHLGTTPDGLAHIVWVDDAQTVFYCYGRDLYWPVPQEVVRAANAARGSQIAIAHGWRVHVVWDESDLVRSSVATAKPSMWPKPDVVIAQLGDLHDITLAANPAGGATIIWAQATGPGKVSVYESSRASGLFPRSWLPKITP